MALVDLLDPKDEPTSAKKVVRLIQSQDVVVHRWLVRHTYAVPADKNAQLRWPLTIAVR